MGLEDRVGLYSFNCGLDSPQFVGCNNEKIVNCFNLRA